MNEAIDIYGLHQKPNVHAWIEFWTSTKQNLPVLIFNFSSIFSVFIKSVEQILGNACWFDI